MHGIVVPRDCHQAAAGDQHAQWLNEGLAVYRSFTCRLPHRWILLRCQRAAILPSMVQLAAKAAMPPAALP